MKRLFAALLAGVLLASGAAIAAEESTVEITGDFRFRSDYLRGQTHDYMQYDPTGAYTIPLDMLMPGAPAGSTATFFARGVPGYTPANETLFTNRFGINIKATPAEDISVKARLVMYKIWGHQTMTPVQGAYAADRTTGPNDGTIGHVPSDSIIRADYAYATVSNIAGEPIWFSVGRRPSTSGIPGNLRQNAEKQGTAGIPNLMVDYAFDGMTAGYAPDIERLPGAYAKICYGRGFDSGFNTSSNVSPIKDTDFLGVNVVPYDADGIHVELQWQKGWNIFDAPSDGMPQTVEAVPGSGMYLTVNRPVGGNLGDIDWLGGVVTGKVGSLNLFVSAAMSKTKPNGNTLQMPFFTVAGAGSLDGTYNGGFGLLYDDDPMTPGVDQESHDGSAIYLGGRYDFASTGTKIGAEYNQGSQYWVGMVPAGDDLWTSKLGTRGTVYEIYVIQELKNKPLTKRGKAFVRLGYQLYQFDYTGSNSWIGAPKKISDLNSMDPSGTQMFTPLTEAKDIYLTFDVQF